ncbi:MAG: sugar phosphate isomerase/epimerase [Spirochaetes bacterium]|nr:sugar phosphate isomerase/epimerase [Spirochaetota bacterium]
MPAAPDTNIAITLYTLNRHCKTEADLDETMRRVKEIGYRAIQISGIGPIPVERVAALIDKHGLYVCATHESLASLKSDMPSVIKKLKAYGCTFTAIGSAGDAYWSAEGVKTLANELNDIARTMKNEGIGFGFHNHAAEFHRFTEKTFIAELYDNAPDMLGEIDTFWVQHGGGSPAAWIRRLKNRMPVIHFKDMTITRPAKGVKAEIHDCAIGEGNLDWPDIIAACRESNVRWFVVEQEDFTAEDDIFAAAKASFENMKKMGIR